MEGVSLTDQQYGIMEILGKRRSDGAYLDVFKETMQIASSDLFYHVKKINTASPRTMYEAE